MQHRSILRGAHAYLSPAAALAGLDPEIAARKPPEAEHSIAEIVAHMAFWQDWFLDRCDGKPRPSPAHADIGWPAVTSVRWDVVLQRFTDGFDRALALANSDERMSQPIAPSLEFDHLKTYTQGDALVHIALHNAHHLGQVITLRQQLRAWPPPAGSWTW